MSADPFAILDSVQVPAQTAQPIAPSAQVPASIQPPGQSQSADPYAILDTVKPPQKPGFWSGVGNAVKKGIQKFTQAEPYLGSKELGSLVGSDYLLQKPVEAATDAANQAEQQAQQAGPQTKLNYMPGISGGLPTLTANDAENDPAAKAPGAVLDMVGRQASDPLSYVGLLAKMPWMSNVLKAAPEATEAVEGAPKSGPGQGTANFYGELSGVKPEALLKASTASGRQEVQAASAGAGSVGERLANDVNNFIDNAPENKVLAGAWGQMEPIDKTPVIAAAKKFLYPVRNGAMDPDFNKFNGWLNSKIQGFAGPTESSMVQSPQAALPFGAADNSGAQLFNAGYIPPAQPDRLLNPVMEAKDAHDYGNDIVRGVDYNSFNPSRQEEALKSMRSAIRGQLLNSAENSGIPEYADAMKSLADKYEIQDQLNGLIGKNEGVNQETRAGQFMKGLFNNNDVNVPKQKILQTFDKMAGTNYATEAKNLNLANSLGEGGKASLFPRHTTGRSGLGAYIFGDLGLPVSSPWIATRASIPLARGVNAAGSAVADAVSNAPPWMAAKALQSALPASVMAKLPFLFANQNGGQ